MEKNSTFAPGLYIVRTSTPSGDMTWHRVVIVKDADATHVRTCEGASPGTDTFWPIEHWNNLIAVGSIWPAAAHTFGQHGAGGAGPVATYEVDLDVPAPDRSALLALDAAHGFPVGVPLDQQAPPELLGAIYAAMATTRIRATVELYADGTKRIRGHSV